MEKLTYDQLISQGYEVQNAKITNVSLNMNDHDCLVLDLALDGHGWGCIYGGYCLGKGYLGANDEAFEGSKKGLEAIMRIMNVVGCSDLLDLQGKYVRVATHGIGSSVKIIGNLIDDNLWFDYGTFFKDGA